MAKKKTPEKEIISWEVDWKKSLLNNIMWMIMFSVTFIFAFVAINQVKLFTEQGFQVMYLIVVLFSTIRLLVWVGHPKFAEKPIWGIRKG